MREGGEGRIVAALLSEGVFVRGSWHWHCAVRGVQGLATPEL